MIAILWTFLITLEVCSEHASGHLEYIKCESTMLHSSIPAHSQPHSAHFYQSDSIIKLNRELWSQVSPTRGNLPQPNSWLGELFDH
ncbi:hypothetical protein AUEXF2481DRAFT_37692 [Aureobasidium subglaciale EXF-2481]|uniref:Secreted protein n=1 Tax=Aureobasidium subglaciale (strain EXF-2481) TaxID=1043005 RepID=A0A074YMA7_AURSE|nr:uncharacterized protein AUEXF2481DRAFT_37692 [Aureobasidium subglaciale EXF-2481]KEQ97164.1 hypothetical protein AUEXF2481DRAFT_37692 [Aureobasidium subglaciale EXF-2481]